jgi:Fe-S-cluster containining protein
MIPDFQCQHCHNCCGPIIWFAPEEILIKDYLQKQKLKRIVWSKEEFEKNHMKCPYLKNDRCLIYSVRPIVCRLQGNIPELRCKSTYCGNLMSQKYLKYIKEEFFKIIRQTNGMNIFYTTYRINFE